MAKPNENVELTNSKGELVASIDGNDDGTVDIVFWNPPKGPSPHQGGNTHVVLSHSSLTLQTKNENSKIVFSFSEDDEPTIELIHHGKVIWSSAKESK